MHVSCMLQIAYNFDRIGRTNYQMESWIPFSITFEAVIESKLPFFIIFKTTSREIWCTGQPDAEAILPHGPRDGTEMHQADERKVSRNDYRRTQGECWRVQRKPVQVKYRHEYWWIGIAISQYEPAIFSAVCIDASSLGTEGLQK